MAGKWLVTVENDKIGQVAAQLRTLGCAVNADEAVPMDDDSVLSVSGSESVETQIAKVPGVKAVYPDSDLTLY